MAHIDGKGWLLYDNQEDKYQLHNLINDPGAVAIRESLHGELQTWLRRTADEFQPWEEVIRCLDLVQLWNAREQELSPHSSRLLTPACDS